MGEESASAKVAHNTEKMEENITSNSSNNHSSIITHFVFIHGVGGGAWCWYKIKCLMDGAGYRATCLDLKGAGIDQNDPNAVLAFDDYNKPLIDFLSSLQENEQVILVGHSAGGLSISDAMNKFGKKKIKLAVFIAATMLKSGFVTEEDVRDGVPDLSDFGKLEEVHDIEFGLGHDLPPTSICIKKEFQRKIIYQMSPHEDSTLASMLLRPGPIQALTNAKFVKLGDDYDEDVMDSVPRIYIKTTHDNVVKPHQQEAMIKKWPPSDVYVLESDHSPFFSAPFPLFSLLVKAALSHGCCC